MSEPKAAAKLSPVVLRTHSEALFDFVDLPPDTEFRVNISGPIPQPYWATLKADGLGQAQLIWRTQAAGDYQLQAEGEDFKLSEGFEVRYQSGEEDLIERGIMTADRDVKSVEEPGKMGDTPSGEMRADAHAEDLSTAQDDPAYRPAEPVSTQEGPSPTARKKAKSKGS